MQCPNDQATLLMTERQGIEIDYCPTCRGVWLDKGELDKLVSSSENSAPAAPAPAPQQQHYSEPPRYQEPRPAYSDDRSYHHKKRRKESFLGDLFDF
ncbi:MAG TPA: zf-TFIIB domain-containing protein [Candidatus Doudnabacteria bacterium]|nr:zf-TFIIB domain-containing protein [Candidatus Doudnabacteria bacterium]